jgi:hypothetical protein
MEGVLAYLFWHEPDGSIDVADYERRLAAFHARMHANPPPGFAGSRAFRVGGLPWAADATYEDWYLVDDWPALGVLNAAAIDAVHAADHDAVASRAGNGAGGVYALRAGALPLADAGAAEWTDKPRGTDYDSFTRSLIADLGAADFALWQRQMVLGPAPELCLLTRGSKLVAVTGG